MPRLRHTILGVLAAVVLSQTQTQTDQVAAGTAAKLRSGCDDYVLLHQLQ